METIEDDSEEDEPVVKNVAPRNKNRLLELADGTDDDEDLRSPSVENRVRAKNVVSLYIYRKKNCTHLVSLKRIDPAIRLRRFHWQMMMKTWHDLRLAAKTRGKATMLLR